MNRDEFAPCSEFFDSKYCQEWQYHVENSPKTQQFRKSIKFMDCSSPRVK